MAIALELLEAYVKCPTKCWLISKGEPISDGGHAQWVQARNEAYLASGVQRLLSETPHAECVISPSADTLKTGKWGLATNVVARAQSLESRLHAVKRMPSEGRGKTAQYSPIRFVPNNRLGKDARLLLAFDALALAEVLGEKVSFGQIIHGDDHTTGTPLNAKNLYNRELAPACDRIERPRISWHSFRHAHATLLSDTGESLKTAQSLLGHSDLESTLAVYTHTIPDSQKRAVERGPGFCSQMFSTPLRSKLRADA